MFNYNDNWPNMVLTLGSYNQVTARREQIEEKEREREMKVYEYVAYYVPSKEQKEAGRTATIILDSKMLAEDEETVKRTAIRAISADYDAVIAQVKVEVRAFR